MRLTNAQWTTPPPPLRADGSDVTGGTCQLDSNFNCLLGSPECQPFISLRCRLIPFFLWERASQFRCSHSPLSCYSNYICKWGWKTVLIHCGYPICSNIVKQVRSTNLHLEYLLALALYCPVCLSCGALSISKKYFMLFRTFLRLQETFCVDCMSTSCLYKHAAGSWIRNSNITVLKTKTVFVPKAWKM